MRNRLPTLLASLAVFLAAAAPTVALAQQESDVAPEDGLSGLTGLAADIIVELGEFGVGVLTFVETVFPPIPSEIVLSLAGYLAEQGRMNVWLTVIAATIGAVLGGLVLYWLGAVFGERRAKSLMVRIPLMEMEDLDKASRWFERYGQRAVFFGRFIPLVRSLVSLPAGAQRMPLAPFIVLTALGSGIWNGALIGAGYALGTQYERIEDYMQYLDYAIFTAAIAGFLWFAIPRILKRRRLSRAEAAATRAAEQEALTIADETSE